jgi:hypothetical protein
MTTIVATTATVIGMGLPIHAAPVAERVCRRAVALIVGTDFTRGVAAGGSRVRPAATLLNDASLLGHRVARDDCEQQASADSCASSLPAGGVSVTGSSLASTSEVFSLFD